MSNDLLMMAALILASALFASSEIAIAAASKIKLRVLAGEGNAKAEAVLQLQEQPGAFFAMIQIALNAIAILGGIVGEQTLTPYMRLLLQLFYQGELLDQISFALSFATVTSLFILFADLLPKRIAMILPETMAMLVVTPMRRISWLLTPLVLLFNGLCNLLLRACKLPTEREDIVTTDDIVAMMDAGAEHGSLQQQEYQLIGNVFELEERTLPSVMTTREQIVYFDRHESAQHISSRIIEQPHNWFLICDGSLDHVIGAVSSKAILSRVLKGESASITEEILTRDLLYLPDTLTLSEGLNAFRTSAQPFAVVVNEYAMVVGVLTIKDLMNSLMGDLAPSNGDEQIVQRDANSWLVDGTTPMIDLARALDLELDSFPDHNQYETAAGFLIYQLKRIPKRTDSVVLGHYQFEAVDIDNLRVDQIMVSRLENTPSND